MENAIRERILLGRSFVNKFGDEEGIPEDYRTDQELKKPTPRSGQSRAAAPGIPSNAIWRSIRWKGWKTGCIIIFP